MEFPGVRMRRLRRTDAIRRMVRETRLSPDNLIQPLFVTHEKDTRKAIGSMPGVFQLSIPYIVEEAQKAKEAGVPAIILFGIPPSKDSEGSLAWNEHGIVQKAIRAVKKATPELCVVADLCFCEYTSHGHCGVIVNHDVDNDSTIENLGRQAVSLAEAGADIVAPSGMMDGMVLAAREALDEHEQDHVSIMSYAVKFASGFYGPFREAAESTPAFGDRRTYQMDPANAREAIREATLDVEEGADMLMVKPALPYLDILSELRETFEHPLAAYNVSGEMAMVEAAAQNGWIDRNRVILETLTSIRRAGADMILTYWATEVAGWLTK
ncbi:MAG: porphobilinogen synthase [Deltaproteobacteria bacterium]|nr:porphobilinogen synthase [Deltaproteobacteria bacterium]